MKENPPGVEFLGTISKYRKRNKIYVLQRAIGHFHVVDVQKRAKKCTKKGDARAMLLFCL